MTRSALLASTAAALILCSVPSFAQGQQKSEGEKSAPAQVQREETPQKERGAAPAERRAPRDKEAAKDEPSPKGATKADDSTSASRKAADQQKAQREEKARKSTESRDKRDNDRQGVAKDKSTKGTADVDRRDDASKRSNGADKRDERTKGASSSDGKDGATKDAARPGGPTKGATAPAASDNSATGASAPNRQIDVTKGASKPDRTQKTTATAPPEQRQGTATRVQISQEQRTTVPTILLKERQVNRAARNVNFSINVGTRVPRSVRLAVLPAAVIAAVPAYRGYRYVVVNDDVCVVEPNTYEIVDVIHVSDGPSERTAQIGSGGSRGGARLALTDDETAIILREVEVSRESTLGLGVMTEGSDVPRNVELRTFPVTVVQRVPKIEAYKYFTAENRIAVVDGRKVLLVIDSRR